MTQNQSTQIELVSQLDGNEKPTVGGNRHWLAWSPVFLALFALLGLLAWGLLRQQGKVSGFGTNDGPLTLETRDRPASDFEGRLYDPFRGEESFRLSDFRGEVVVVNFWASWCPPCREEAPILEQMWRRYRDQGVVFIGIDIWDTEQDARAYMDEFAISFPNLIDERGRIAVEYGLTGVPETYFITADGMISRRVIGAINRITLEQNIQEALAARGASD